MAETNDNDDSKNAEAWSSRPLHPLPEPQPPNASDEKARPGFITEFSYTHTGQFPDPYTIKGYKRYAPEIVPIIIEETQMEAKHRRDMEKMVKQAGVRRSTWGMNWAGTLGVTAIVSATYLGLHGATEVAVALVSIPMVGYLTAFLVGSYSSRTERIEKEKIRRGQMEQNALSPPEGEDQV